jgi:CubicO group peptidase (beta-lactamase class C family)
MGIRLQRYSRLIAVVVAFALLGYLLKSNFYDRAGAGSEQKPSRDELGTAMNAKIVCTAVFVTGREPEEAIVNSGHFSGDFKRERITQLKVDRERKEVHLTLDNSFTRTAKFFGDQGCVILPRGKDGVFFKPVAVRTQLPSAANLPWPMGDALPGKPPAEVDGERMRKALDIAFSNPAALTQAIVIVHKGHIVAERYAPGTGKETQLESWSMGKSITATLIGVLAQQGRLKLSDPAPIAEWQKPGDPRAKISVMDLLRMSSGLKFSGAADPPETWEQGHSDHIYIYSGAIDAFDFSINRPPEFPPNTVGRYRNCDPLVLGAIIKRTVTSMGEEYLTWPQRALFDRIGIRRQVLEPDPYGNFLLTGYDYGTARNWARLGLLYLWNGVWQGKRILPEGFVEFVRTQAPAWKPPVYGGLFWVNHPSESNPAHNLKLPQDTYYMAGAGGQMVFIVPSHDLVIVRMGHGKGGPVYQQTLGPAIGEVLAAVNINAKKRVMQ